MATGRENQLTKQIGEYLVCAELCRRKFIATTFTGNVPDFDILAITEKYETKPIQVKAIKSNSWQFDAGKFLDISISSDGIQTIKGKKKSKNPDLICIFIKLISQGKDKFYIFKWADLQNMIYKNHSGCLKKHNGKRPRSPKSTHTAIFTASLSKYENNWTLLG